MLDIRQRRMSNYVRYVFDPAKADDRFDYGEVRELAFGLISGRLFACVYADREAERRVISLRKGEQARGETLWRNT